MRFRFLYEPIMPIQVALPAALVWLLEAVGAVTFNKSGQALLLWAGLVLLFSLLNSLFDVLIERLILHHSHLPINDYSLPPFPADAEQTPRREARPAVMTLPVATTRPGPTNRGGGNHE